MTQLFLNFLHILKLTTVPRVLWYLCFCDPARIQKPKWPISFYKMRVMNYLFMPYFASAHCVKSCWFQAEQKIEHFDPPYWKKTGQYFQILNKFSLNLGICLTWQSFCDALGQYTHSNQNNRNGHQVSRLLCAKYWRNSKCCLRQRNTTSRPTPMPPLKASY